MDVRLRSLVVAGAALALSLPLTGWEGRAAAAAGPSVVAVASYPLPTAHAGPDSIITDTDGSVWFSEAAGDKIGHLDQAGIIHEYPLEPRSMPSDLTIGPDGNIWFVEEAASRIGRLTPTGVLSEFVLPPLSWPAAITTGPDKALWFTENGSNRIGRIAVDGTFSSFATPTPASRPLAIVAAPDGNLWFTENAVNQIASITIQGTITEYSSPTPKDIGLPMGIAIGSDNRIWFIAASDRVAAIAADGQSSDYSLPSGSLAIGLTATPNGTLWYSDSAGSIGELSTAGLAAAVALTGVGAIGGIVADRAGHLWISDISGNDLIRLDAAANPAISAASSARPATSSIRSVNPTLEAVSSRRQLSATASTKALSMNPLPSSLPTPYWWNGDCDANNFPGSFRLGATFLGMPACGPLGTLHKVTFPGNVVENEWQCPELVMRYLYLAFQQNAYQADGGQVVQNYPGSTLVRIPNGTQGQAPAIGDVLSYGPLYGGGHTSIVTSASYTSPGNGTIAVVEQNASTNGSGTISVLNWVVQDTYGYHITQWLHWPLFNLLVNGSLETGSTSPWAQMGPGLTQTGVYNNPGYALEGSWYLEMNVSQTGGSVYQDVLLPALAGQSYSFALWLRSLDGSTLSGTVALFAMGNGNPGAGTNFSTSGAWTQVSIGLPLTSGGHTALRAQIYLNTVGHNLDIDGAQLTDVMLTNASFETGSTSPWAAMGPGLTQTAVYNGPSYAHDGSWYFEMNVSQAGGSVYQDVAGAPQPDQSFTLSIWVRSADGSALSGSLALFAMGNGNPGVGTSFSATSTWSRVSTGLPVTTYSHSSLRAQIYLNTTGHNLDLDASQLVDSGLTNASFETGSVSPWAQMGPGLTQTAVYNNPGYAHEGSWYMEFNVSQAGGSVYQDVPIAPQPGQSFTFTAWVECECYLPWQTASGALNIFAMGNGNPGSTTNFVANGLGWTRVSVAIDLPATSSGHNALRVQIYLNTTSFNLDVDATTLAGG